MQQKKNVAQSSELLMEMWWYVNSTKTNVFIDCIIINTKNR